VVSGAIGYGDSLKVTYKKTFMRGKRMKVFLYALPLVAYAR